MPFSTLLLAIAALAQTATLQLPVDDAVRIPEFYRLESQIQDKICPNWSRVPAPVLLVTQDTEFSTQHPAPPPDFRR
jgi:hypothetical protein